MMMSKGLLLIILSSMQPQLHSTECKVPQIEVYGNIGSDFGERRGNRLHWGVDIIAPVGTRIESPTNGTVVFSGVKRGYGRLIIIKDVCNNEYLFAHNSVNLVNVGDIVKSGQHIADVGKSGNATGAHLHLELKIEGRRTSPLPYLNVNQIK